MFMVLSRAASVATTALVLLLGKVETKATDFLFLYGEGAGSSSITIYDCKSFVQGFSGI
jgi:hypothetical protein